MEHSVSAADAAFIEPIAIIGIGCRFPGGVGDPASFWDMLCQGRTGISEIPADRWNMDAMFDPDPDAIARSTAKWGGFLDDIRGFDPGFFDISPRIAASMDPQQRILLQVVFEALQDALIPASRLNETLTGVYVGVSTSDYGNIQLYRRTNNDVFATTGSALSIVANRVSHCFDLQGPSYSVDTACSSSLVALDQACRGLNDGACEIAICAGVNILADPMMFIAFSKANMLSPTGQIYTFDARANGYVRGEGAGVVVLKRLSRAVRDGDEIYALVRGTGINQDGWTTTLTAPNPVSQAALMTTLCERAEIDANSIGFVEAHGTGTPVGDPIEASSIGRVFGMRRANGPLYVGSVKPNLGHLESAAGIASLIKSALMVRHGRIPPNLNFEMANPLIPLDALNIRVPMALTEFGAQDEPRLVVVNSFGFGGTNAGAVLEDYRPRPRIRAHTRKLSGKTRSAIKGAPVLFPLSAATPTALAANAEMLATCIEPGGALHGISVEEIAASLARYRDHLSHRIAIPVSRADDLAKKLRAFAGGGDKRSNGAAGPPRKSPGRHRSAPKIAFTFSGQGAQWWSMARRLLTESAVFRRAVEDFDAVYEPLAGWSTGKALLEPEKSTLVNDSSVGQPAIFAVQIGLAACWRHHGVVPDLVIGHSFGEVAAAHTAGVLSLETAAHLIHKRAQIRQRVDLDMAMAVIGLEPSDIAPLLPAAGAVEIACYNGPSMATVSGPKSNVESFVADLETRDRNVFARVLSNDTAWHSSLLDVVEDWFRDSVGDIEWKTPTIPFVSSVTGLLESRLDLDYWWQNLRRPVRYQNAVDLAFDLGADAFVELGPDRTLSGLTSSCAAARDHSVTIVNSIHRGIDDFESMAGAAGALYTSGYDVDWSTIIDCPPARLPLPRYVWTNEELWRDSEESRSRLFEAPRHPLLGYREPGPLPEWSKEINLKSVRFIGDHVIQGDVLFPASGYIEMILAAAIEHLGAASIELEEIKFVDALFIGPDDEIYFRTVFDTRESAVQIFSRLRGGATEWTLRVEAKARRLQIASPRRDAFDVANAGVPDLDSSSCYELLRWHGCQYGPAFQCVQKMWFSRRSATAELIAPDMVLDRIGDYCAHPVLLDSCLQSTIAAADKALGRVLPPHDMEEGGAAPSNSIYPLTLPTKIRRLRMFAPLGDRVYVRVGRSDRIADDVAISFAVRDGDGRTLLTVDGLSSREVPRNTMRRAVGGVEPEIYDEEIIAWPITTRSPGGGECGR